MQFDLRNSQLGLFRGCLVSLAILSTCIPAITQLSQPELLYAGHAPISYTQVVDCNDDGLEDLFISRLGETAPASHDYYGGLYMYTANGGGAQAYTSQKVADGTYDKLWLIDYDHDGDQDILARDRRANGTHPNAGYAYARNDDGIFFMDTPPPFLSDSFYAVQAVADLNGDLIDDVLYRKQFSPDVMYVATGLGDGTFNHTPLFVDAGQFLFDDLNDDGLTDFVMSDTESEALYYYASKDILAYDTMLLDSQFQSSELLVAIGEFTGSGEPEVLYHHLLRDSLYLITQLNSGAPQHRTLIYSAVSAVSPADFNADGSLDLYLQGEPAPIFINDGTGQFNQSPVVLQDRGVVIYSNVDIDAQRGVHYFQNNKASTLYFDNGMYAETQPSLPDLHFDSINDVEVRDIDGDSLVEVFLSSRWGHAVTYLPGLPFKQLGQPVEVAYDEEGANNHQLADVDRDGNTDIVYSSIWDGDISVKYGDGAGNFCCKETLVKDWGLIWSSAAADFEGDSFPDVVAYSDIAGQFIILHNHGGAFEPPEVIDVIDNASNLRPVDIDSDGDLDILTVAIFADGMPPVLAALVNDGTGGFDSLRTVHVGQVHDFIDFDNDGMDEIVYRDNVYKYDGDAFSHWFSGQIPQSGPDAHMYLDYSGDGYIDLLVQDSETGDVALYQNIDNTAFEYDDLLEAKFGIEIPPLHQSADQYTIDLDGDGDRDLLFHHHGNLYRISRVTGDRMLRGITFWDQNADTIRGADEPGIDNMRVQVSSTSGQMRSTLSRNGGLFEIPVDTGLYTITTTPVSDCWEGVIQAPLEVHMTDDSADFLEIPFMHAGDDIGLTASLSRAATRCGFQVRYYFKLINTGCAQLYGKLRITLDPRVTEVTEISVEQYQLAGNVLELPLDTLLAGEELALNVLTGIPGVASIGEVLRDHVLFQFDDIDGSVLDRSFSREFSSEVTCAYDPNDKVLNPDRRSSLGKSYVVDEDLQFTIRFQNTGNDTAFNVRLSDTLSAWLDLSTLRAMDASHPYRLVIDENSRALTVYFDNILLPDSNVNSLGSNGFFTFSIRPVEGLDDFTPIENSAGIYFDFNPPIITNIVQLEYLSNLALVGTREITHHEVDVFPNPSTGRFFINTEYAVDRILMYSATGYKVFESEGQDRVDARHLANGLYYVMIFSGENTWLSRIVILH